MRRYANFGMRSPLLGGDQDAAASQRSVDFAQLFIGQLDLSRVWEFLANDGDGIRKLVFAAMKQNAVDDEAVGRSVVGQLHECVSDGGV